MNRNRKNYLLYILIILLISIGYAITQSNLMINGTGKIASTKFDVYFENLTVKDGSVIVNETAGDKAAEILENNTQKVEYSITFKEPGEFYEFEVYAVNNGSTDVKIQTILSKINNEVINNNIPSYLDYSVLYEDGTPVSVDDVLQAGTSTKMKVKIEFKTDINPDELPDSDIDLSFSFEITYIQTDEVVSTLATYRVIHKRMNLNGTAYDIEETEEFEGNIGDQVTPSTKSYTGFTSPSTTTTTLDSSSVKTIEYLYDRNKYNLTVTDDIYVDEGDLSGEYYYETPITLTAKNRSGYGFDRWSDGTETNPISFTISENTTLQPLYYPEGKVAEMDGVYYDSVTAALAQVPNNTQKTIRLLTNTTEAVTVAANKNVILNLRSYEINNTTSKVITNKGKLVINNGTLSCTKTNVISNENDMVINGTTINCSADSGAINNEADSNLTVTDATVTATGKRQAIYNNGGVLYVNGDTHLSNKSDRGALHNLNSGTVYLESGTITSTSAIGAIYNQSGTVNIGKKDGRVTNVTPEIIGNNGIAIKTETGTTLNFYDGIVKSTNNLIDSTSDLTTISNKINEIEEDSEIIRENDSTYKKFFIRLMGESYTVILNPNGGTVDPENVTVLEGTEIGLLPTPERELHDFVGWYTGIDTGILIESSYIPQGDMEIFARWNKKPTYTIKFETDTNTTLDDKEILQGDPIGSIETITKTGMVFDGWYLEDTFNTKVNDYYVPESNITLYAKWIETTFPKVFEQTGICDFNGTISGSECQKYNGKTYIDTKVSLYNETNIDKDYEIHFEIVSYNPSENESQATFFNTKQEATGYPGVVVRKGNNNANQIELASRKTSSTNESYNINYGEITTLSIFRINNVIYYSLNGADKVELNNLTQYNPIFDLTVWFGAAPTDGTATSARRFFTGKLKNMYIKLGTYVEEGKYRIDYNVNGGNPLTPSYKNVVQGEKIGTLPTPTRTGYYFDNWYTHATNGTLVDANYIPQSAMPIYAHWKKSVASMIFDPSEIEIDEPGTGAIINITNINEIEEEYVITSDNTDIVTVEQNGTISDINEGQTTITITGITSNQTIQIPVKVSYPRYTIQFETNGGRPVNDILVTKSKPIGTLPIAYRDYYNFTGWYTGLMDGVKIEDDYIPLGNMKLYARYEAAPVYTVSFDANGGTVNETSRDVTGDMAIGTLPIPEWSGYYFTGWLDELESEYYTSSTIPHKDVTLKAQWSDTDPVARINSVTYETLQEAINAAVDDDTIFLLKSITENTTNSKNIIINLDGYTINGSITNTENGTLELLNGKIIKAEDVIYNDGELILGDINPKSNNDIYIKETSITADYGRYYYAIKGVGNITLNSGVINSNSDGIVGQNIIINGGTIDSKETGIQGSNVKLNGGTINSNNIGIDSTNVVMNGGKINIDANEEYFPSGIKGKDIVINNGLINIKLTGASNGYSISGVQVNSGSIIMNGGKITAYTASTFSSGLSGNINSKIIFNNGEIYSVGLINSTSIRGILAETNTTVTMNEGIIKTSIINSSYGTPVGILNVNGLTTVNAGTIYSENYFNDKYSHGIEGNTIMNGGTIVAVSKGLFASGIYFEENGFTTINNGMITVHSTSENHAVNSPYSNNGIINLNGGYFKSNFDSLFSAKNINVNPNKTLVKENDSEGNTIAYIKPGDIEITLDPNEGEITINKLYCEYGKKLGYIPIPIRTGYYFDGWYTSPSTSEKLSYDTVITENKTYYAHWKKSIESAIISNNNITLDNNSSEQINITNYNEIEEDFYYLIDNEDIVSINQEGFLTAKTEGKTVVYIIGQKSLKMVKVNVFVEYSRYNIKFNTSGGHKVNDIKVIVGDNIGVIPDTYSDDHKLFEGWYTSLTNGIKVDSSFIPEGDITLYAKWNDAPSYTVELLESDEEPRIVYADTGIGELPIPTKEHYYFVGWMDESDQKYYQSSSIPEKDLILTPQWTSTQYVARNNNNFYSSITSAINDSSNGDEIVLLKNTTESIVIDKDIILDLNKYTLTGGITVNSYKKLILLNGNINSLNSISNSGVLEIGKNQKYAGTVNITRSGTSGNTYGIYNTGTVIINNGTISVTSNVDYRTTIGINGGDTIINGGIISVESVDITYGISSRNININSGRISVSGAGRTACISSSYYTGYTSTSILNSTLEVTTSEDDSYGILIDSKNNYLNSNISIKNSKIISTTNYTYGYAYGIYGNEGTRIIFEGDSIKSKTKSSYSYRANGIVHYKELNLPDGKKIQETIDSDGYSTWTLVDE